MPSIDVYEIRRRAFVAQKGDEYAIETGSGTGKAHQLAKSFAATKIKNNGMRGLESLAWSTESVADILDFIRIRVGRDKEWGKQNLGKELSNFLENIPQQGDFKTFVKKFSNLDRSNQRELHLELCRVFIKHLVAHFEFYKKKDDTNDNA